MYDDLARHYGHRLANVSDGEDERTGTRREHYSRYLEVSRELLHVERQAALRLRDEGRITDDMLRQLEHELDLSEIRLKVAIDREARNPI